MPSKPRAAANGGRCRTGSTVRLSPRRFVATVAILVVSCRMSAPSDKDFFWKEYERVVKSVPYKDMNSLQKAILGMEVFVNFTQPSGIDDSVVNRGFSTLLDSENAFRRIGRDDVADRLKRAAKLIRDCAVRHGLSDKKICNNDERTFRKLYGEGWDQEIVPELGKIDEILFAFRDDFVSLMGRYLRKQK